MNLHLFDLRPIKDISTTERANLAVSISLQPDGTQMVVSRYDENIWDFYPYIPQDNLSANHKRIDWRIQLPDGRLLTDQEHAKLLESAKEFIWSLFIHPVEGRQRPTMHTLILKVHWLCPLLRWMVTVGLHSFADLAGHTHDFVAVARVKVNGGLKVDGSVVPLLIIVEDIYHQRDKINDALHIHPWPHESANSLAGIKRGGAHRKPKTEFIPDFVVVKLAEAALDYIQNRAAKIFDALEAADTVAKVRTSAGLSNNTVRNSRTDFFKEAGLNGSKGMVAEKRSLRTACYIVIDMFSGIRDSEMMSIGTNCIAHGKSKDGSTDVLWLHGMIYKTGKRPKKWMVPPVVEEAVNILTRLTEPFRKKLQQEERELEASISKSIAKERAILVKRLYTIRKQMDKIFLGGMLNKRVSSISVLSGKSMGRNLKKFCEDLGIKGEDGKPYRLHSHQFRRTYARFMARAELGDLLTLRDHFGHWSIDMTVYYADGGADDYEVDTELVEMITEEKLVRQNEVMGEYLNSGAPLANGGHWLKHWRSTVRTAPNKEALIAEYAGTITLNGTGHSWCIGNAKGTGCGGLCVFEAQMCVDCNYGIIGQEHRPVWQGILEQQHEALALDDMGPGGKARAQKILEYAAKVLRRLDGQEVA